MVHSLFELEAICPPPFFKTIAWEISVLSIILRRKFHLPDVASTFDKTRHNL